MEGGILIKLINDPIIAANFTSSLAVNLLEFGLISKQQELVDATLQKVKYNIIEYPEYFAMLVRNEVALRASGLDVDTISRELGKINPVGCDAV